MKGIGASPGIVIGQVWRYLPPELAGPREKGEPAQELQRLRNALDTEIAQTEKLCQQAKVNFGPEKALIFEGQLLLLKDPSFFKACQDALESSSLRAEEALATVVETMADKFQQMPSPYLQERAADIRDVGARIMNHLTGVVSRGLDTINQKVIVVAHDLSPSDTARLDRNLVLGFVTEIGSASSHTGILARSLGIPAVVGCQGILGKTTDGELMILDGTTGTVILNPGPEALEQYREAQAQFAAEQQQLATLKNLPGVTADGHRVTMAANVGKPGDLEGALEQGAEGIGLFRTEFLFMDRDEAPGEEEQYQVYRQALELMEGQAVIIRTLDFGGDKQAPSLALPKETNPFLGLRGLRLCLARRELFMTQLRALLRAGVHGKLGILLPMVATGEELRLAKALLKEAAEQLREEGVPFAADYSLGIMIEVPGAALIARQLAREVDFFSIGTNDLIQYVMAADRMNQEVAYLYQPLHPGVLSLISMVVEAGHQEGIWVGVCGEMAGDPLCAQVLVGLGVDELSMSSRNLPRVKKVIRGITYAKARELADKTLNLTTAAEVNDLIEVSQ